MSLRRLLAVSRKEVLQLSRDRRSLGLAFLLPLLLLLLFGYAISWDVHDIETAVWDSDRSAASRELLEAFRASGYFSLVARVESPRELRAVLDGDRADLALVVPAGFAADLGAGRTAVIQAVVDGSDANTATIALSYARSVALGHAARLRGGEGDAPRRAVELASRVWYNEELASRNMIVPGLVPVIMMIIAAMLTSLTLAREWERGTMEQLAATPVGRAEVVLGKLLPYLVIGMVDVAATSLLGVLLFGVPFRGSVALLALLSFLVLVGASGLGIFISAGVRSQLLATQAAMIVSYLPALLLSGFMFAIAVMPAPLRAFTYLVPARYFLVATRGIFLKGVGLEVLAGQALLMLLFAVGGVGLAIARFRKELG
jgi:ABC-2 type transport system permease protein